ncbi:restriction endonuclease subunit S [Marinilactibacillus psychrotolerans]|uniref:restriction endonuclease subunit S n=1 Tax=Marinilactibacillus psychrotolerans TaxID=191770 RepID=UPI00388A6427
MNLNKDNKYPEIRFKGFTEDWEQRKLGELSTDFEYGLNASATSYDGINKYIRITDISEGNRLFNQSNLTSPDIDFINADNYLLKKGDILFARTGASVGKSYRYQESDGKVYYAGFLIRARINTNYDTEFIFQTTLTNKYEKFVEVTSQRSGQPGINAKEYANFKLNIPKLQEQKMIGSFFKQLDNTIALHQDKLDKLKSLKKGYLQALFPITDEKVPKIRFANFIEPWEQRKLDDISYKITEKNKNNIYNETLTNSAELGIISQRDFFEKEISNKKNLNGYYIVRPNDFVYNPRISNYALVGPVKRNNLGRIGVMSPLYYVFRTKNISPDFLEKYFDTTGWHSFMKLNGDSGARADRFAIKDAVFKEMPIPYPEAIEQEQIGNFFKQLDVTITLHQQKLVKLTVLKKAYLKMMYV